MNMFNFFKIKIENIHNSAIKKNTQLAIPFWIASLLTGLIAVLFTRLFNVSENLLHQILNWHKGLIFIVSPLSFLVAYLIINYFAPSARGSGIPQVMAAIDLNSVKYNKQIKSLLNFKVIIVKMLSSLLMVFGGGAVGREGPTIQIAGSVFRLVNKYIPASWPRLADKSYIVTGAAAGLAAAFNTPLGGIVFAVEELAKIHISFIRTALFTAVIIAGLTAQSILGPYLYLGYPQVEHLSNYIFIPVIIVAIVAGLAGGLMCKLILLIMKWRSKLNNLKTILWVLSLGLIVATITYYINDSITGSGKVIMNTTLFTDHKSLPFSIPVMRILGPIIAFNTGAAGGVFAPSLAAGASIGAFISGLLGFLGSNANILILSGMVGFLTGVTRTPFTSAILVLEMTDRHSVIFHLMVAALIANVVTLLIDKHSFYEILKDRFIDEAKSDHENDKQLEVSLVAKT